MKKLIGSLVALTLASSAMVQAEVSGNIGVVSDYYYRGTNLGDAGVYGGLDYEQGGFFAGTWLIDDGGEAGGNDGLEADFYVGYGQEVNEDVSWSVSYTRFTYTYGEQFEHEIGGSVSASGFSVDVATGEVDPGYDGETSDYKVFQLGYSKDALGVTVGAFRPEDSEGDYEWAEFSVGGELAEGIEASFAIGRKRMDDAETDGYMYLDVSKSFDLF